MTPDLAQLISKIVDRAGEKYREQHGHDLLLPPGIAAAGNGEALLVDSLATQLLALFGLNGNADDATSHAMEGHADPSADVPNMPERNRLLARALGACECWGEQPECKMCYGQGGPGWALPHKPLFDRLVRPALQTINTHKLTLKRNGNH
jgi:hypothetical protein